MSEFLFFPGFIVLWCGMSFLRAVCSGWSALAGRFRAKEKPAGEEMRFVSVRINDFGYRSTLKAIKGESGLYLEVLLPWRLGHPPVFIPWSEMKNVSVGRSWLGHWVYFTVSVPWECEIELPPNVLAGKIPNVPSVQE